MANSQVAAVLHHLREMVEFQRRTSSTDGDLVERFAVGHEEAAFAELVRRHGRLVWRLCRNILKHEQDAEDAFQATFLVLARRALTIRKSESVASWLYGVAYRISVRAKRMAAKRSARERRVAVPESQEHSTELAVRDLQAILDEELLKLPQKYQAPFVLCCLEGHSRAEAAAELGWKDGTVSGRIAQARRLLQSRLAKRGVTFSATMTAGVLSTQTAGARPARILLRVSTRIGSSFLRGSSDGGCSAAAMTLADGALRAMTTAKLVPGVMLLVALSVLGSGVGVFAIQQRISASEVVAAKPNAPGPALAPEKTTRADQFGEPLPDGAVARLGTRRLKHASSIKSMAFTTSSKQLLSLGHLDGMRVWDAASGKEIHHLAPNPNIGGSVADTLVHPDGRSIVTLESPLLGELFVRTRNLADMSLLREFHVSEVNDIALSPDGKYLFCAGRNKVFAEIWDLANGQRLHFLRWHGWPYCHAFSPDGKTLVTSGADGIIGFWDVATGEKTREITGHPNGVMTVALSGDGQLLATLGATAQRSLPGGPSYSFSFDRFIRIWNVATGKEVRQLAMPLVESGRPGPRDFHGDFYGSKGRTFMTFAPDGTTLIGAGDDGVIRFWDPAAGKEVRRVSLGYRGTATMAIAPDGKTYAVAAGGGPSSVFLVDAASGQLLFPQIGHSRAVQSLALTPDCGTLATLGGDNVIRLWDPVSGRERPGLIGDERTVTAMSLAGDGHTLVSIGTDKSFRVWDLKSGKEVRRLSSKLFKESWVGRLGACRELVGRLALSSDGRFVLVAAHDKPDTNDNLAYEGLLLDISTGREIHRFGGHNCLEGAAFTPDGRTAVTWDLDRTVRLWDAGTGEKRREYRLISDEMTGAPPPNPARSSQSRFRLTAA
jgi:RNA polymerase sigma factor (sigma-70 family)